MTLDESSRLVAQLAAAFPNAVIQRETAQVYSAALADLDPDAAQRAIVRIIATSRFFPSIAEIRSLVAEEACGLPDAEQAWLEVAAAVRAFDDSDRETWWPEWSAPIIGEALLGVGSLWSLSISSNPSADRAQFARIYNSLRRRQVETVALGELCAPSGGGRLQLRGAARGENE
jgi:hypothetical protein